VRRIPTPPRARFAVLWSLSWALAIACAGLALVIAGKLTAGPDLAPLIAGIAPALAGAGLATSGERAQKASLLLWMLAAVVAALLTGGVSGPLAVWSLAPLAAAAASRNSSLLPLGAAAALAAAAVSTLSTLVLPLPSPVAAAVPWLAVLANAAVAVGLGAALIAWQAEVRRRARGGEDTEIKLLETLENQPLLLLGLYPGGRILEAFGPPPPGWRSRELIDRNFGEFVHADDRPALDEALQAAVSSGSAEIAFRPAHDPEGWWELSLRRVGSIRMVGAVRDARAERSRLAQLEAEREAAEQQNQAKSRFLANMSHELRTPLNAIMGFSDIMRRRLFGPMSDRYADYAELVHESGAHLLELINDVLDMSKIEAERFELALETFDARDAISAALRLMRGQADRAGVNLRAALPNEALEAHADRRALKQIAINLVSNALKFTPRGGAVTLTLQAAGDVLELVVADTGVGIGPEDLERLGRPFEQAGDANQRSGGSGLGLSLVRAFAQLHGGEMLIESELGEGTTVLVRLPVLVAPLEAAQPLAADA